MKLIASTIFSIISFYSIGQINFNDSLKLICQVYQLEEFDKVKFDNYKHPKNSIFIMYNVNSHEQEKVFQNKHITIENIEVYLCTRAYIISSDISYWLVIDKIEWGINNSKIFCRTIKSDDAWIEKFDKTDLCIEVEFKRDENDWVVIKSKINKKW